MMPSRNGRCMMHFIFLSSHSQRCLPLFLRFVNLQIPTIFLTSCKDHLSKIFVIDLEHSRNNWTQMLPFRTFFSRFNRIFLQCFDPRFLHMVSAPLNNLSSPFRRHDFNRRLLRFVSRRKRSLKSLSMTSVQLLMKLSMQYFWEYQQNSLTVLQAHYLRTHSGYSF